MWQETIGNIVQVKLISCLYPPLRRLKVPVKIYLPSVNLGIVRVKSQEAGIYSHLLRQSVRSWTLHDLDHLRRKIKFNHFNPTQSNSLQLGTNRQLHIMMTWRPTACAQQRADEVVSNGMGAKKFVKTRTFCKLFGIKKGVLSQAQRATAHSDMGN